MVLSVNNLGQAGETSKNIVFRSTSFQEVNMHAILYGTSEDPDLILVGIGNKLYIRDINSTT